MTDKEKLPMSLNVSDQQFIKRLFDRQDDVIKILLDERDEKLLKILANIEKRLDSIEGRLNEGDIRFAILEKYASIPSTLLRLGITILIGVFIGYVIHSIF